MKLEVSGPAAGRRGEVEHRLKTHLEARGYKLVSRESSMKYRRGSLLGSLTGMSPRRWQVEVTVEYGMSNYRVLMDINTTGQMVVEAERKYWEDERDWLKSVVEGHPNDGMEAIDEEAGQIGKRAILLIVGYSIMGALGFGVIYGALYAMGIELHAGFPAVGAGVGAAAGFRKALSDTNGEE